jgi:hypothetical protein
MGDLAIKPKVLVSAASRHHGTWEIAQAIATGLVDRGVAAEARPIEAVTDLADYGAVVRGRAVYRTGGRRTFGGRPDMKHLRFDERGIVRTSTPARRTDVTGLPSIGSPARSPMSIRCFYRSG